MTIFYLDYESGNDNYSGTSFSLLASGSDGAINNYVFSSATANFPNDGTLTALKNICWYSEFWNGNGNINGIRLLSLDYYVDDTITPPTGLNSYIYYMQEYPNNTSRLIRTATTSLPIVNSTQYTYSAYVKGNGRNKVILQYADSALKAARFNLSNGTVEATGASATSAISSAGNGWYRISITFTSSAASAGADIFALYIVDDSYTSLTPNSYSYDGDSTKGMYVTAFQIEAAASVTSYEKPPGQCISIFNGSIYALYYITSRVNSTTLNITSIPGGTAMANTSARQYYIGGRWQTFTNGATAVRTTSCDIIRLKASPDPTSIGSATWNGSGSPPTVAIASSTNASPIAITTSAVHGLTTGDTVFICDHTTNTNANGTWEVTVTSTTAFTLTGSTGNGVGGAAGTVRKATNCVLRLSSALNENIASHGNIGEGRTAWTPTTNNTAATSLGTTKQGNCSDQIGVGAAFTTGLVAYKSFSVKNLSGYQQLSFWVQQTAGTLGAASSLSFSLCSDTAGATVVNTFNFPAIAALNTWTNITIDLGTNLGASIQSIGFYVNTDNAAQTFLFSNIIACKASSSADSLTLSSLIGKNTSNESWYPIQSIVGTRVIIDTRVNSNPILSTQGNFTKGYYGTNETVTTYKRETIKTVMQSAAGNGVHTINDGQSHFQPNITIEGGYDRTNMSSQSGYTFYDGQNGFGYAISQSSKSGWGFNRIGFVRYDRIYIQNSYFCNFRNFYVIAMTNNGLQLPTATQFCKFENLYLNNNYYGLVVDFGFNVHKFTNCYILNNSFDGLNLSTWNNNVLNNCYINNNGRYGIYGQGGSNNIFNNCSLNYNQNEAYRTLNCDSNIIFNNCSTSNNALPAGNSMFSFGATIYLNNCTINETNEFNAYGESDGRIYSHNHDNTSGNHYIFTDQGLIRAQTSVRYSSSGLAWSLAPTSDYRRENYPLGFSIGQVGVSANSLVTIKSWMRRTNKGLSFRLRVKGGQIAGVSTDVIGYMTAAADTWEQVSISFTPTESGVIEILAECWGGSSYTGYIDDLSITQV
jgi:hypothetical protein